MSLLKYLRLNSFKNVINNRVLSTQTQPQEVTVEHKPLNVSTRVINKRPQKPPFMKNLFLGTFDTDLLAFPEVLDKEEQKILDEKVSLLNNYFSQLDSSALDQSFNIPNDVRNQLVNLNIFGLQTSKLVDGLELSETENCRVLEVISNCRSLATSVITHQYLGVNAISTKGSEKIVEKYLPGLSKGDIIAAFCLLEDDNYDPTLMKTKATLSDDGKYWILNGKKSYVVNGSQGDLFIVVACTRDDVSEKLPDKMSVLVVEKSFGGIKSTPCQSTGFKGADICHVTFENTKVPVENVLGEGGDSVKVLTPLLSGLRLSTGPGCVTLLQNLVRQFSEYCVKTKYGQNYLCDTDFIRDKIAQINMNLYAVESITYVTAGLLDKYERQDCDLESAIVKVFSSEKCLESVQDCVKLIGSASFTDDHWLTSLQNDALGYVLRNETNDSLRIIISLLGLQHTGVELKDSVKKFRNPFFFPGFIVRKMFEQRRQVADDPKLNLGLENYLHPSLTLSARWLEYCVLRLQYATELMLIRHGPKIVEQHMELKKLADVAIDVFTMVSVLSRASRSYCIGLRNADCELLLANAFCFNARNRVKQHVQEISLGPFATNDATYQKIAKRALKFNGYFAEHALTKNF